MRSRRSTPKLLLTVFAACMVGCVHQPQTREEFVQAVRGGASFTQTSSFTVGRDLESVVAVLERKSEECLTKTMERPGAPGAAFPTWSQYLPSVGRTGADAAEFTLRVLHSPRGLGEPDDGAYTMAADLSRAGPSQTKADLYFTTVAHADTAAALRAWIEGKPAECPDLD